MQNSSDAHSSSGRAPRGSSATFSGQLEAWLLSETPKTLGALGGVFGEKGFAATILFLMFVPALPLPTGGVSHVFEAVTVVLAAEMVLGRRTIWLPQRWQHRELGGLATGKAVPFMIHRIRWFEKFSRPRGRRLFRRPWSLRLLGVVLTAFAIGAAAAPPFSGLDTLPALGAVAVALSIILEDVVVLGIGIAVGAAGIAVIATLGAALVHFAGNLF